MESFLEKLHQKPVEARKRIALGTSTLVTLLVAVIWVSVTDFSLQSKSPLASQGTSISAAGQVASPLAGLRKDVDDLKKNITDFITLTSSYENTQRGTLEVIEKDPIPAVLNDAEFHFEKTDGDGDFKVTETVSTSTSFEILETEPIFLGSSTASTSYQQFSTTTYPY